MLDDVGERLLDDAVGGLADAARYRLPGAAGFQPDLDSGVCGAGDELAKVGQSVRRGELRSALRVTQDAEQPAHLAQRAAAGGLDGGQSCGRLSRTGVRNVVAHTGLDGDQAQAVRHHVVELAGDPQPFLGDRAAPLGELLWPAAVPVTLARKRGRSP